jgi:D-xylose transport system permease protein
MSDASELKAVTKAKTEGLFTRFLRATEIDSRMLGMFAALMVIWVGFDIYSGILRPSDGLFGGTFLTPRNLWTLLVQTSSIAVMATGMVLIIVMRHIDLSVGSILAFVAVMIGSLQVYWLPALGLPIGHPMIWIIALVAALLLGSCIGAFHGLLIAYAGIPAFIVTLGGLIFWRGASWAVIRGETVAPMDATFKLIGGGISGTTPGSIGASASWVLGLIACGLIIMGILYERGQRRKFSFPLRPIPAESFLAGMGCLIVLGTTYVINQYFWPVGVVKRWAKQENITIPEAGFDIPFGYAIPVLIVFGMAVFMTFISRRTRFGRYIYSTGGNPEAAELAGINTKRLTVYAFAMMGTLAGISACISTARLNAASNALGLFDELFVIAAAVIGGTSLGGGVGTVYGAVLGALVMQSLQSGMTLLNFESAYKDMVVGGVLVFAVWADQAYRRRIK